MTVRNLKDTSFDELLACFLRAFAGYYVTMPTDKNYYKQRWKAAKVNFSLSYGMFDEGEIVGFIIHAVDVRFGVKTAFNTGTGVIPEYRGRRVVKSIYEYAINDLRKHGIEKSSLEVITKNEHAIRAYKSVGFDICKEYRCFAGTISTSNNAQVEFREVSMEDWGWEQLPNQKFYSWDFQKETIVDGNYVFYQVLSNNQPESYFIINPENKYLAQFDVLNNNENNWNRLFEAIKRVSGEVRIINVDKRLTEKLDHIHLLGLKNTVNQYEMELIIAGV
ncbi:GNAT family N-acetyltransferase [Lewinella sp. W8]|uniref:GNAT family N-acetyltransferase n=1 Tax=Lewinella sp. W8 TaxID=2528208 RepID=UPI00106799D8|nr:GNAT family N-acetyltransferase [Lewinella sp. W8]MTB51203.1 GNAT family N-acetyltransferase [Lewinella sp. W8]